jgi:hypothetical protein
MFATTWVYFSNEWNSFRNERGPNHVNATVFPKIQEVNMISVYEI